MSAEELAICLMEAGQTANRLSRARLPDAIIGEAYLTIAVGHLDRAGCSRADILDLFAHLYLTLANVKKREGGPS